MNKILLLCGTLLYTLSIFSQNNPSEKNQETIITNVNYVDVINGEIKKGAITIKNGIISKISKKHHKKHHKNIHIIDGKNKWLIPGLVDAHIHLFQSGGLYTRPDAIDLTKHYSYEKERKWVFNNTSDILKRYLRTGITTVIDIGGPKYNFSLRDSLSNNQLPNIFLTGPLVSTYQPKAFEKITDSPILKATTATEAIKLVQDQLSYKPDFIKIWYIASNKKEANKNFNLVESTIKESHKNGLKVAVHATQLHTAKLAVKAGADILVHSISDELIDLDFALLLAKKKIIYIPTLLVHKNYQKSFTQQHHFSNEDFEIANPKTIGSLQDVFHLHDKKLEKLKASYLKKSTVKRIDNSEKNMLENLKLLISKGVIIATGTDAGNIGTLHASSYYPEVNRMRDAGLSNLDILRASTINGAKVLNKENKLGSITEGKIADLVLLNKNPLKDINAIKNISHIIKSGHVFLPKNIIKSTPEQLVQQQVNAYNSRNIEAFLAPYSEDVEIYDFPNELTEKGKNTIRHSYKKMFKKYPKLHCNIVNRTIMGNTVIDHERVTGIDNKISQVIAIYKIHNNKIAKVYFIRP